MTTHNSRHFLRHIAPPALRRFTDAHALNSRLTMDWSAPPETHTALLCDAVDVVDATVRQSNFDVEQRKAIETDLWLWHDDLRRASLMSGPLATQEFCTACANDSEALDAVADCDGREMALWMLAWRERVFRHAELHLAFQAKSNGKYWKKHRIQAGLDPVRDQAQLELFSDAVSKLYEKVGGGRGSKVELIDRAADGSVQLMIYVEGPITAVAHFEHGEFILVATRIALEAAIQYHASTGIVETIVKGGVKNHAAVLQLFGTHATLAARRGQRR